MNIDQGDNFGKWKDDISKLMYYDTTIDILKKINTKCKVADYGGGNGIIKEFIDDCITIDIDKSKNPDINDNILTHQGNYDLVIIRYVIHYLNDIEVIKLFKNLKNKRVLLIQFCNNDLKNKYRTSKNETKYFRTESQLEALLPDNIEKIYSKEYTVTPEFYKNRLNLNTTISHKEILNAYLIEN